MKKVLALIALLGAAFAVSVKFDPPICDHGFCSEAPTDTTTDQVNTTQGDDFPDVPDVVSTQTDVILVIGDTYDPYPEAEKLAGRVFGENDTITVKDARKGLKKAKKNGKLSKEACDNLCEKLH